MHCWHMDGAGNDFMVVDARGKELDFSQLAIKLCKLTGADGLMAVQESEIADFQLHFYNSDGSRGELCGNGSRCVCRFAYEMGIAGEIMTAQTDAGLVEGRRLTQEQYLLKLGNPSVLDFSRKEGIAYVELGNPGIPHAVMELDTLTWEMREALHPMAKALRYDSAFPKGVNVNFFTQLEEGKVRILTYERGVEDYTLACGTGSASTALTLWAKGLLPGGALTVENQGGTLKVTIKGQAPNVEAVYLEGPTKIVKVYEI